MEVSSAECQCQARCRQQTAQEAAQQRTNWPVWGGAAYPPLLLRLRQLLLQPLQLLPRCQAGLLLRPQACLRGLQLHCQLLLVSQRCSEHGIRFLQLPTHSIWPWCCAGLCRRAAPSLSPLAGSLGRRLARHRDRQTGGGTRGRCCVAGGGSSWHRQVRGARAGPRMPASGCSWCCRRCSFLLLQRGRDGALGPAHS